MTDPFTTVRSNCIHCGKPSEVLVPTDQYNLWRTGMKVQDAFPEMPADQREILISGTHPKCWDEMWKDSEDEPA